MAAKTINDIFYIVTHYATTETLGDVTTTVNTMLEAQYIPMAVEMFNAITDLNLVTTGLASAVTFGTDKEYENQVTAYIAGFFAELDLHPKEDVADLSPIYASKYMQMALQILQAKFPDRIEARPLGGIGMVWMLNPKKRNNISLILGLMRSSQSDRSFGSEPGEQEPTATETMYGR